jgi:hypothetical protein
VGLKFIYIFAVFIILKGRSTACLFIVAGFFYACTILIQRFCTPVWSVNAPTALEVISSGKGRTVFYFCPNLNIWDMLITEKQCTKSAEEIVKDFVINDDVKNIKQTLTELFYEWVQSEIDYDQKQRSTVLFHYRAMMDFMDSAETFETERRAI